MGPQLNRQPPAPSPAHVAQNDPPALDFDAMPPGIRAALEQTALQKSYTAARFAPKDKADLRELAEEWYDSDLLPEAYYPPWNDKQGRPIQYSEKELAYYRKRGISRAVIVMRYGAALGVLPEMAIRLVYIIDGQPSPAAALMLAIFLASPVCAVFAPLESTAKKARMRVGRKGQQPFEVSAEYDEYKHLHGRKNWLNYPTDLVYARCLGRAMRRVAPDLFAGVYCAEERVDFNADRAAGKAEDTVDRILSLVDDEPRPAVRPVDFEAPPARAEAGAEPTPLTFDLAGLLADVRIAHETGDASLWPGLHERMLAAPIEHAPALVRARIEALTSPDDKVALEFVAKYALDRVPRGPALAELSKLKEATLAKLRESEAGGQAGCAS
jgi:hypothetical protein